MTNTSDKVLECECSPVFNPAHFRIPLWHRTLLTRYRVDIYGRVWDTKDATFVNCPDGYFNTYVSSENGDRITVMLSVSTLVRSCWWNADLAVIEKSSFKDAILKEREYHKVVDQLDKDPVQFVVFDDTEHDGYRMYYRWADGVLFSEYRRRAAGEYLKRNCMTELREALVAHYDKIPDELAQYYLCKISRLARVDLLKRLIEGSENESSELDSDLPAEETETVPTVEIEPVQQKVKKGKCGKSCQKITLHININVHW